MMFHSNNSVMVFLLFYVDGSLFILSPCGQLISNLIDRLEFKADTSPLSYSDTVMIEYLK